LVRVACVATHTTTVALAIAITLVADVRTITTITTSARGVLNAAATAIDELGLSLLEQSADTSIRFSFVLRTVTVLSVMIN